MASESSEVDGRRVHAPSRRQCRHILGSRPQWIDMGEEGRRRAFAVVVSNDPKSYFRFGEVALVPKCFTRVRIGSTHLPILHQNPGVLAQHPIHAEKLNLAQFPTESGEKMEAAVGVICGIREIGPHDQGPSVDRR